MNQLSLFERIMFEAPGNDPPDISSENIDPPDIVEPTSEDPPDINNDSMPDMNASGEESIDNIPPDMNFDMDDNSSQQEEFGDSSDNTDNNLNFDDKISAIMNMNLYQRFLSLLNNVSSQLSLIRTNNDMLYTLSKDSLDIIDSLKKLDENIRLYLTNYFINENYSKNLLFFNKCLNLLNLLNIIFRKNIQKGIKAIN